MTESYPYELRSWYPHMKPNDIAIWERFIIKNPYAYDFVQYDVPCGDLPEFDVTVNPDTGGNAALLYKKKIDVVGFKGDRIDIIEVKPRIGASAIGQVKNYRRLYARDYSPPTLPNCVILTDDVQPSTLDFAEEEGVRVVII